MKRHCCTLLLGALAIARVHAGETNGLSMTVQVLAPAQRMVKNTHELLVTITNSSTVSGVTSSHSTLLPGLGEQGRVGSRLHIRQLAAVDKC